jgi:DNA-binding LytR/AlgR family response regulator
MSATTALIADDEPLLRERLASHLSRLWPQLEVVAQARNGREAVELFEQLQPQVAFLDVHMPGMNGIEVARCISGRAELVFVTAYEDYAVEAFRQGAIDYIVKPLDEQRLADTVERLRSRMQQTPPALRPELDAALSRMLLQMRERGTAVPHWLRWIRASVGSVVHLIPVEQVVYLKSATKYTLVVWEGGEALIRKTIREMAEELDPEHFVQIHRSAIVNLSQVARFSHGPGDAGEVHLRGRSERLPVSRNFVHLFHHM